MRSATGVFFGFFLSIPILTSAVSPVTAQKIRISREDGVSIVHNPENPAPPPGTATRFVLTEELTIRDMDEMGNQIFAQPRSVKVDDSGNIYILDLKLCRIQVVDPKGRPLHRIGKKGQGPGELALPSIMEMMPDQQIMVYDVGNRKVSLFSLDGSFQRDCPIAEYGYCWRLRPDSRGNLIMGRYLPDAQAWTYELVRFNPQLQFEGIICSMKADAPKPRTLIPYNSRGIRYWITPDDNILWGDYETYELRLIDRNGRLLKKIIKDYTPIKVTKRHKQETKEENKAAIERGYSLKFPTHYQPYQHFYMDEEGRIYVRTWRPTEDGKGWYYDFFDSEGRYIAHLPVFVNPWAFKQGKLYTMTTDQDEMPVVRRFAIEWR
jgi:6-bladed beta-propeller protein